LLLNDEHNSPIRRAQHDALRHPRSTVHDFSTLRLHPDGTRVPISSPAQDTINNSRMHNTGRNIRGNRVARDAAGLGVVPKRVDWHILLVECMTIFDTMSNPKLVSMVPSCCHTTAVCDACSACSNSHSRSVVGPTALIPGGRVWSSGVHGAEKGPRVTI